MDTERASAELRIGELSRRVGVSEYVLRAWESRYGLLNPARSPGGYRLYSEDDQSRVRRMQAHLADGLAAAQAARAAIADEPAGQIARAGAQARSRADLVDSAEALRRALDEMDEPSAQAVLDRLFTDFTVESVLRDVLLPYLHELGSGGSTERSVLARSTSPVTSSQGEWRAWPADGETAVDHAPFWPARPESCMRWP